MWKAALSIVIFCLFSGKAFAVIPHEGNYTQKQMAGMVVGYLMSDEVKRCSKSATEVDNLLGKLMKHYGFNKDDLEEDSPFGRKYVAKGRVIARQDARETNFCQDVEFEIQQDTFELLPH